MIDVNESLEKLFSVSDYYEEEFEGKIYSMKIRKLTFSLTDLIYWEVVYSESPSYDCKWKNEMKPFYVKFTDRFDFDSNFKSTKYAYSGKYVYIANIAKIDEDYYKFSGTEIMNYILYFLRKIGVKKAFLLDQAAIDCGDREFRLSLYKILTKGETFYEKFGFRVYIDNSIAMKIYNSEKVFYDYRNQVLSEFKNITVKNISKYLLLVQKLLLKATVKKILIFKKNVNDANLLVTEENISNFCELKMREKEKFILKTRNLIQNVMTKFDKIDKKYFYELFLYDFENQCKIFMYLQQLNMFLNHYFVYKEKLIFYENSSKIALFFSLFGFSNVYNKTYDNDKLHYYINL